METFSIEAILKKKFEKKEKTPVVEYEYQDICLQMEEFFGKKKLIWALPHRIGYTNHLMRYALKECITRKKNNLNYFIAIIENKIK